jgi:hypothetical protein
MDGEEKKNMALLSWTQGGAFCAGMNLFLLISENCNLFLYFFKQGCW